MLRDRFLHGSCKTRRQRSRCLRWWRAADMNWFNFRRRSFLRIFGGVAPLAFGQDRSGVNAGKLIAINTPKMPWKEHHNEKTGRTFYSKDLIRDGRSEERRVGKECRS